MFLLILSGAERDVKSINPVINRSRVRICCWISLAPTLFRLGRSCIPDIKTNWDVSSKYGNSQKECGTRNGEKLGKWQINRYAFHIRFGPVRLEIATGSPSEAIACV